MPGCRVLMSIKPRFTKSIFFDKTKVFEFRKTVPQKFVPGEDNKIYVYECGSDSVVGFFTSKYIDTIPDKLSLEKRLSYCAMGCVSISEFSDYSPKYGYIISDTFLFGEPIPYSDFAKNFGTPKVPPQSWQYF